MSQRHQTSLRCRERLITFEKRPLIMSIVNINDDSFSGDGTLNPEEALTMARRHVQAGADIIDAGAESARTNREAISVQEEINRLAPFIESFYREFGKDGPLLSVNSWRPEVARAILPLGVDILNDIGALPTNDNAAICAEHGTALLIMHSVGEPKIAHLQEQYPDVIRSMLGFFEEKIADSVAAGLPEDRILLDPGIDFAKQRDDNLTVFRELEQFHRFGRPVLLPVSRKTVIGDVLSIDEPANRDAGTVACIAAGIQRGAHLFRVHNTGAAKQAISTLCAL